MGTYASQVPAKSWENAVESLNEQYVSSQFALRVARGSESAAGQRKNAQKIRAPSGGNWPTPVSDNSTETHGLDNGVEIPQTHRTAKTFTLSNGTTLHYMAGVCRNGPTAQTRAAKPRATAVQKCAATTEQDVLGARGPPCICANAPPQPRAKNNARTDQTPKEALPPTGGDGAAIADDESIANLSKATQGRATRNEGYLTETERETIVTRSCARTCNRSGT